MTRVRGARSGVVSRFQVFSWGSWTGLLGASLGLLALALASAQPTKRPEREITLTAQSVPLSTVDPRVDRVGSLRFLGGLALRSEDPDFGGLSGLSVEGRDGAWRLLAITDQGDEFSARLILEGGALKGLEGPRLGPLLDLDGHPVSGKSMGDAESVTRLGDGRILVGFERRHRIWAYGPGLTGPAKVFETPAGLGAAPANGGLESIANWPDGRVLAITEQLKTASGNYRAFLLEGGKWSNLEWTPSGKGFEASDAAALPGGDLLVLERYWSARNPGGLSSRIMRVRGESVRPGAVLRGELVAELKMPLTTENFEGLSAFKTSAGKVDLVMVSDDNFNGIQRTLLLAFEMQD